jgi:hypothetical protein
VGRSRDRAAVPQQRLEPIGLDRDQVDAAGHHRDRDRLDRRADVVGEVDDRDVAEDGDHQERAGQLGSPRQ